MSKKTTKNTKEVREYAIGDSVLGKIRGFPPWPAIVVDPNEAPPAVRSEQPPGKKSAFQCVLFFPKGDYAWLTHKDLSALLPHEIEAFLADDSKKRNGELREGYQIARDPSNWIQELHERRARMLREEAELEENAQVDQLESEGDGDDGEGDSTTGKKSKSAVTKKRKRESDAEAPAKAKKGPRAKKEAGEPKKRGGGRKNGAKSKATVESEDEGEAGEVEDEEDAGPSKKATPPPAKRAKREKDDDGDDSKNPGDPQSVKVRDWRHRLQKTFLSNKTVPRADSMSEIDELFTTVEKYEEMTIEQLQFSKIGKVMRHIAAQPEEKVPRDGDFKFRARAKALVDKWHQILNANKPANGSPTSGQGQANGKTSEKGSKGVRGDGVEEEVTQGTRNLDLNGNDAIGSPVGAADTTLGDLSLLDVTMSEAA
ncbi:unnamed protein product [Cyclocybe aegerita]|uniref:PWWP domain-containing protein n=1 Tax=Cyclocybe aegerita TaxID=1973307 RepID=A0A8S0X8B4_CYCAE|nr:unnamed protein product [Cyclocybe aegerita]